MAWHGAEPFAMHMALRVEQRAAPNLGEREHAAKKISISHPSRVLMQAPTHPSAIRLGQTFTSLGAPCDLVICLDGSGSVSAENFTVMKHCANQLTSKFTWNPDEKIPPTRFALLQFNHEAHLLTQLTPREEDFASRLQVMTQVGGGTSAKAVLIAAMGLLRADNRPGAKAVVLITDGDVQDAVNNAEVAKYRSELKAKFIIVGVGLNPSGRTSVESLLPDCHVYFNTFQETQDVFLQMVVVPSSPPQLKTRTRTSKSAQFEVIFDRPYTRIEVQHFKMGTSDWKPGNSSAGTVVKVDKLEPATWYNFRARVQIHDGAWSAWSTNKVFFCTLPQLNEYLILSTDRVFAEHKKLQDHFNDIVTSDLLQDAHVNHVNIVLMGRMGNGKSCFLNTLKASLMDKFVMECPTGTSAAGTFTKTINRVFLNKSESICLWDTWGWDGTNWTDVELECLLGGRIPDGYSISQLSSSVAQLMQQRPPLATKPHGLLLVVSLLENSSLAEMNTFKQFYQKICDRGIQPIVVLTKPDQIGKQELQVTERSLQDVLDNGVIDEAIDMFCANTGVARDYTYPVRNYTGGYPGGERSHVLEKLALNALNAAVLNAMEKVKRELQLRIRIINAVSLTPVGEDVQLEKGDFDERVARLRSMVKGNVLEHYNFRAANGRVIQAHDEERVVIGQCRKALQDRYVVYVEPKSGAGSPSIPSSPVSGVAINSPQKGATVAAVKNPQVCWRDAQGQKPLGLLPSTFDSSQQVSALRAAIMDDLEETLPTKDFEFLDANNTAISSETVPVTHAVRDKDGRQQIVLQRKSVEVFRVSVRVASDPNTAIGQLMSLSGPTVNLKEVRKAIEEDFDDGALPANYRFLASDGSPVQMKQEQKVLLELCLRTLPNKQLAIYVTAAP